MIMLTVSPALSEHPPTATHQPACTQAHLTMPILETPAHAMRPSLACHLTERNPGPIKSSTSFSKTATPLFRSGASNCCTEGTEGRQLAINARSGPPPLQRHPRLSVSNVSDASEWL